MKKIFILLLIFVPGITMANTEYIEAPGQHNIECYCIKNTSACNFGIFNEAVGSPVHIWTRTINVPHGGALVDLTEACYRRRNDSGGGAGMCCNIGTDESNKQFFKGVLSDQVVPPPPSISAPGGYNIQ